MEDATARERKRNYASTWQVERRRESVISVWNRNRERPTHIEVLSVCTADAAIQSNPIPVATQRIYIWTNRPSLFLSLSLSLPLTVTFFRVWFPIQFRFWPKFYLSGRASFFPISNDLRSAVYGYMYVNDLFRNYNSLFVYKWHAVIIY